MRCHGADGSGDPRSVGLNPSLDLAKSPAIRAHQSGQVFRRIAYGYGPMPGFAHRLDTAQMQRLTDYTLQLVESH